MASPIRELLSGQDTVDQGVSGAASQDEILFGPTASTWADPAIAGGGYGHAQLSHATGLLWLTDLRAEEVYAQMSAPGTRVELYDALVVRFTNGAIGTISVVSPPRLLPVPRPPGSGWARVVSLLTQLVGMLLS